MLKSPLTSVLDIEEATLKVFFLVTENPIIAKNFTKNLSLKNNKKSKQKKILLVLVSLPEVDGKYMAPPGGQYRCGPSTKWNQNPFPTEKELKIVNCDLQI